MCNARRMRCCQTLRNLYGNIDQLASGNGPAPQERTQGLALNQFAHGIWITVYFPKIENGNYMGVVQGCHGACLGFEASSADGGLSEFVSEDLDRYIPTEAGIARAIDLAHATDAKSSLNLIRSYSHPAGERGGRLFQQLSICGILVE
jgi:hypothetical protein